TFYHNCRLDGLAHHVSVLPRSRLSAGCLLSVSDWYRDALVFTDRCPSPKPKMCYVVEQSAEEEVGCLWRPELTDAVLPCSYRLSLANCGMAVSYYRDRLSFRKRSNPS